MFTPIGPPNNYAVSSGNGTDCVTLAVVAYDALPTNAEGLGPQTITLTRSPVPFFVDTFAQASGTSVLGSTPDVGGAFARIDGSGTSDFEMDGAGRCFCSGLGIGGNDAFIVNVATPPSPDYTITGDMKFFDLSGGFTGVMARMNGAISGYEIGWQAGSNQWQINKLTAGARSTLVSQVDAPGANVVRNWTFSLVGDLLTLDVAGVGTISVNDATFSIAGEVGLNADFIKSTTTGRHIGNLSAI